MSENRVRAKIIENNRSRAELAASSLERTIVLHGDGLDSGLLEEANVLKQTLFWLLPMMIKQICLLLFEQNLEAVKRQSL